MFSRIKYVTFDINLDSLQSLDPLSGTVKRHMFFGLMKVFRREYIAMCLLIVLRVSLLCVQYQRREAEISFPDSIHFPQPDRDQPSPYVFG